MAIDKFLMVLHVGIFVSCFSVFTKSQSNQEDEIQGISSEAGSSKGCYEDANLSRLDSFVLCVSLKLRKSIASQSFMLSFESQNSSFQLGMSPIGIVFKYIKNKSTMGVTFNELVFETPTPPDEWRHVCIQYNKIKDQAKCFVDGKEEIISDSNEIIVNQKKWDMKFSLPIFCVGDQYFTGDMVELKIWPYITTDYQMVQRSKCNKKDLDGNAILDFSRQWKLSDNMEFSFYSRDDLCLNEKSFVLLNPAGAYQHSLDLCLSIDGTLASTKYVSEVLALTHISNESCITNDFMASWNPRSDESNNEETFTTKCLAVNTDRDIVSLACVRQLPCSVCRISLQRYTLYGHEGDYFDYMYYLKTDLAGKPYWEGIGGSLIQKANETWILSSPEHRTQWYLNNFYLPVGRFDWHTSEGIKKLTFTSCKSWQFGCNDGKCIEINQRCDDVIDCPDRSDEDHCQVLEKPEGYDPLNLPPARAGEVPPLDLHYHVDVYNLEKMTTAEGVARMDLGITMTWFDPRIKLNNLKPSKKNYFSCNNVWVPLIRAVSGHGAGSVLGTNQYEKFCFSFANDKTEKRSLKDPLMAHTADGSTHPLVHYLGLLATVPCSFTLYRYPFDIQYCNISFKVMNAPGNRVFKKDTPGNLVPYLNAKTTLLEYELVLLTTEVGYFMQGDDNITYFAITFHLHRLYGYHITNSFFPSLLMTIISYSTYFFRLDDFTNRIMVSLTAQLVLASLFSSTTASSVKTPYLKLIDLWYAAVITFGFLIIVSQVYINVLFNSSRIGWFPSKILFIKSDPSDLTPQPPFNQNGRKNRQDSISSHGNEIGHLAARKCNRFCYVSVAIIVILFVLTYALLTIRTI